TRAAGHKQHKSALVQTFKVRDSFPDRSAHEQSERYEIKVLQYAAIHPAKKFRLRSLSVVKGKSRVACGSVGSTEDVRCQTALRLPLCQPQVQLQLRIKLQFPPMWSLRPCSRFLPM